MKKRIEVEGFEGEIDDSGELVNRCLGITDKKADQIMTYLTGRIAVGRPFSASRLIAELTEKYKGMELFYAVYGLGFLLGKLSASGLISPSSSESEQEGYL